MRGLAILLMLLACVLEAEELLPMDESPPEEILRPTDRVRLSAGGSERGGRLRGEWLAGPWHLLGDLRPGSSGLRGLGSFERGSLRLEAGRAGRPEGLLGLERRRSNLEALPHPGATRRGLSLGAACRAARLLWRRPRWSAALAWDEYRGPRLEWLRKAWWVEALPGRAGEGGALALGRRGSSIEVEMAAAGAARRAVRLLTAGGQDRLSWGMESLLVSGARPETWSRLGWIGADKGAEARFVLAWEKGPWNLRGALRWREGLGLSDLRRREEIHLSATLRQGGRWRCEFRRRTDRDREREGEGPAFPQWASRDSARWETRLSWKEETSWIFVLRSESEEAASLLLRVEPAAKRLPGDLEGTVRLDLFRCGVDDSFRLVRGDALGRRSRSLYGQGGALALSLRWRRGSLSARLDADAGHGLSPGAGLSLHWQPQS